MESKYSCINEVIAKLAKVKMEKRELIGIYQSGVGQFTVFILVSRMDVTFAVSCVARFCSDSKKVIEEL